MSGLALSLLAALVLLTLLGLAVRDVFRQTAPLGWGAKDEAMLTQVLQSGVESLG